MRTFLLRGSLGLLCVAAFCCGNSRADSFRYDIQIGSSTNFRHSYIHSASSATATVDDQSTSDDFLVRMGGQLLFELDGFLNGTITDTGTGWNFVADASTLSAKVLNVSTWMGSTSVGDVWDLNIASGSTLSDVNKLGGFGASGQLNYTLTDGTTSESGSFYFFADLTSALADANVIKGAPNSITDTRLDLWGNNWKAKAADAPAASDDSADSLGIDLGGVGEVVVDDTVVPLPANAVSCLLLLGTAGMLGRGRLAVGKR